MTKLKGLSSFIEGPEVDHKFKTRITKEQVGLDQVDNTSDKDKPISDAAAKALQEEAYQRVIGDALLSKQLKTAVQLNSTDKSINIIQRVFTDDEYVPTDLSVNIDNKSIFRDENGQLYVDVTTNGIDVADTIQVSGGPLAEALNKAGITTINKDISMQELLVQLFTKEIYPTEVFKEATISNSIAVPPFNVSNQILEVNSSIAIPAITSNTCAYWSTPRTLSGLTYGYSIDGITKIDNTTITNNVTDYSLVGDYILTRTIKGVSETQKGSSAFLGATTMTVDKGSNLITISFTGPKTTGTVAAIPSVYKYSNLSTISESQKTNNYAATTISTAKAPSASKDITITGVYPVYATTDNISTLTKQAITSNKTIELTLVADSDTEYTRFALQKDEVISGVQVYNTISKSYEDYPISNFKQFSSTQVSGGVNTEYILYVRNEGSKTGSNKFKITLK